MSRPEKQPILQQSLSVGNFSLFLRYRIPVLIMSLLTSSPSCPPSQLSEEEIIAWLRLTTTPGVTPSLQRLLLAHFGLPEQILAQSQLQLARVIGEPAARALLSHSPEALGDKTLSWLAQEGNHLITLADPRYPARLLEINDPPAVLYVKGDPGLLSTPCLAMVGARSATAQGVDTARAFAEALLSAGLTIVSGLALGIDAAAHQGALAAYQRSYQQTTSKSACKPCQSDIPCQKISTIAVIGTGADLIYPARNAALAREIAEHGAIVSEFPLGTPSVASNFPRRNRLIAGISLGVLVVEAALKSGSLITARHALDYGREVLAIPGSIHSPLARGCHQLIRQGAKLVESAQDVLEELHLPSAVIPSTSPTQPPPDLPPGQSAVLSAMGFDPVHPDTLAPRSGLTIPDLCAILIELELNGQIAQLPGGLYQRRVAPPC